MDEASTLTDGVPQSKITALARFEFESAKGKAGSKVLMVEWDTSLTSHEASHGSPQIRDQKSSSPTEREARVSPDWKVSWEGMPMTMVVRDREERNRARERQLFLLPPACQFPADITITHRTGLVISTKPLPAIYPEGLGLEAGSKGVLHTLWAKNRVADLEDEIQREMSLNAESVGLEMVMQEKQWILDQFGIALILPDGPSPSGKVPAAPVPSKPHLAGRLADQFRGLKLATSPEDLAAAAIARNRQATGNIPRTQPIPSNNGDSHPRSEAAASVTTPSPHQTGLPGQTADEEDLFALPMSPRSPEMKRSPFSLL
ncbi:uncharacterized protein DNG_06894 [Cephalotrichum gorgonifer]|uniref:Uncharacterized protein n=1 Tax=Cephalotrichum gorgonifer TaxID=2041049 RepID=A0AAE8N0N0_9PEZI|nr:uncharacterized protein DNG_06894 [Cephalotrichum gorgonifer]